MAFHSSIFAKIAIFTLLGGIATPFNNIVSGAQIGCPLVWQDYELSTNGVPPIGSVSAFDGDLVNFVIRGVDPITQSFRIGRLDVSSNAYIVIADNTVSSTFESLQILVNVHDCHLSWARGNPSQEFLTRASAGSNTVVGRVQLGPYVLSGEVDTQTKILTVVNQANQPEEKMDFEYLLSTSDGFKLEFTDLVFNGEFSGMIEFLGIDEIMNQGAATISQSVKHSKLITKATRFKHDGGWAHCSQASFDFGIDLKLEVGTINLNALGLSVYQSFGKEMLTSETAGSEVEQDLTTIRGIKVESYTHVQACTLIGKINKFSNSFTATGKYTAKGWTSEEVYEYLSNQPNPPRDLAKVPDATYATSTESGVFSGELYLNNVMAILDRTNEGDCIELEKLFNRLNRIRSQGIKTGIFPFEEEKKGIESKIAKILSPKLKDRTNKLNFTAS